jgi:hypothetical protein
VSRSDEATVRLVDGTGQALGVDSGFLSIVDPERVDDFLAAHHDLIDGSAVIGPRHAVFGRHGVIVGTDGDGEFPFWATVIGDAVHTFETAFDASARAQDNWLTAGRFTTTSGTLLVGDPGFLHEYGPDPFDRPVESWGAWAMLALPGPGWIDVHLRRPVGRPELGNLGLRAVWHPDPAG